MVEGPNVLAPRSKDSRADLHRMRSCEQTLPCLAGAKPLLAASWTQSALRWKLNENPKPCRSDF